MVQWVALVFYALVALWALDNTFGARKGLRLEDRPSILRTLWETYLYVAMFLPMAWHYFAGGIRALFGVYGDFHRTPKGQGKGRGDAPPLVNHWLLWGEVFSIGYSLLAIAVAESPVLWHAFLSDVHACEYLETRQQRIAPNEGQGRRVAQQSVDAKAHPQLRFVAFKMHVGGAAHQGLVQQLVQPRRGR